MTGPSENSETYPPYDIVRKGEDAFQINLALAGFAPEDITITSEASQLTVSGKKPDNQETEYLYQGISARAFERRFNLADYIEVENASFENGLLHINLVRRSAGKDEAAADRDRKRHQAGDERNRQGRLSI